MAKSRRLSSDTARVNSRYPELRPFSWGRLWRGLVLTATRFYTLYLKENRPHSPIPQARPQNFHNIFLKGALHQNKHPCPPPPFPLLRFREAGNFMVVEKPSLHTLERALVPFRGYPLATITPPPTRYHMPSTPT